MPPGKKSIFRQPGAQHFQLVHRSQRDPLINDPDASQRVLKPFGRGNEGNKNGTTLADLEATIDKSALRPNEGEAALYGITYDDSSYDYMAHLKPIGLGEPGADSILIEGPRGSATARGLKNKGKGKAKADNDGLFNLLPPEVLSTKKEGEMSAQQVYAAQAAVPLELQGLQPDMDPHLRQVLEALDDEEFIDDESGEGWFDELLGDGERDDGEEGEWEFREEGIDDDDEGYFSGEDEGQAQVGGEEFGGEGETWEDRYKAFKAGARGPQASSVVGMEDGERSEMADTIGSMVSHLGEMTVAGGKKRRGKRGPSDATGMSMSSSSMFRNQGLRTLDERFDKVESDYDIEEEDEDFPDDDDVSIAPSSFSTYSTTSKYSLSSHASTTSIPEISREDFDNILDDFLENYEVVGNKYQLSLGSTGLTGPEKLKVLRSAVEGQGGDDGDGLGREENRRRILEIERLGRGVARREERERLPLMDVVGGKEDKWDAETILTTYTNTENHPAMIRTRTAAQAKARAAQAAQSASVPPPQTSTVKPADDDEDSSGSETEREDSPRVISVTRPKGETKEERKERKAAIKAERSSRRAEKKHHKETFGNERKRQIASHGKMVANGRAADLSVGGKGIVSLS